MFTYRQPSGLPCTTIEKGGMMPRRGCPVCFLEGAECLCGVTPDEESELAEDSNEDSSISENTLKSHSVALCGRSQDARQSLPRPEGMGRAPLVTGRKGGPSLPSHGPSGPHGALYDAANNLAKNALSPATLRSYDSAWRKYLAFCSQRELPIYGEPETLALWIAEQVGAGAKLSTIEQGMSAVAKAWSLEGHENPRTHHAVRAVYAGTRRTLGVASEGVDAIGAGQLREVIEALPSGLHDRLRSCRAKALLTMGWAGGFRVSELLALRHEDVSIVPEGGLLVRIRRSKTDQEGKGRSIGIPYSASLVTCPVRSYAHWREESQISSGPIFRGLTPDGLAIQAKQDAISVRQAQNIVATAASRAGLVGRFASHSLRVGFVTEAMRAKKNPKSVMQQTGHHSVSMVLRYARDGQVFDDNAAEGLL